MKIEKTECSYQVTECDLKFGEQIELDGELLIPVSMLDKIKAEINGMYRVILKDTPKDDWAVRWNDCLDDVLQIIDKYKAESEG